MAFLIDQIQEQKLLDMEVDFNSFIESNQISEQSMIHTIRLSKDVFATEAEAREYLKGKFLSMSSIKEDDQTYTASIMSPSQIDAETEKTIQLRRGVEIVAGDLLPVMTFDEVQFNDKGEINLSSKFGTIDLSEGLPHMIEIARVAEGHHPSYGHLKITQENLEKFVINFKSNVTGVDLAVNEDHKKNEAFGWLKDIFLSYDKQVLYGQVNWNAKGTTALSEKEYRYFSPEFRFNYVHPHTGIEHGPTLLGGALTNYPFLKMEAITELNNKESMEKPMNTEKTIDLSVHDATVVELNGKITDIQGKLDVSENKNVELSAKVEELTATIEKTNQEKVHNKLFSEGKISNAQLVALNEGKNMLEVLSLNENMNTEAKGTDKVVDDKKIVELSGKEKSMALSLGLTDEEYANYNK